VVLVRILALVIGTALAIAPALAQSTGAALEGRAVDDAGAGLPGARIVARNPDTGLVRSATTAADGSFRFANLPIGSYDVSATLAGFATLTLEDVSLNVASSQQLLFELSRAGVEEAITVTAEAELIRTAPAPGAVVSEQELENLPLNGRQFASLGTLAPGTTLGVNDDPTKVGKLIIGLNGGSGRNVNFLIDGGDNTDDTIGGQLQNFSLESVAEFNFQTQQFNAEYGRTTGGVLTVVTKSGTNQIQGSVFGFFRDEGLNSRTTTQELTGAEEPDFSRDQYGASIGGPISRDRAHFFAAWEKLDQEQPFTVNTNGAFPEFDGGTFPKPTEDELATAKATWTASPQDYLQVRYGYQETTDLYLSGTNYTPTATGDLVNDYGTILVGWDRTIGSSAFNQLVAQFGTFENAIGSNSPDPITLYVGSAIDGQNPNVPQTTLQEKLQIKDDFTFGRVIGDDRHDFKVGVEHIDESPHEITFLGERLAATSLTNSVAGPYNDITGFVGQGQAFTPNDQYRAYLQDDWQVTDRVALNIGVRYEYSDVLEIDQRASGTWQSLAGRSDPSLPEHFRDFFDDDGINDADDDDFAPRVGFTWDLDGDGSELLRGGWGLFYDFPYTNATTLFPLLAIQSNFGLGYNHNDASGIRNLDGTFWQPGDPLPANQLPGQVGVTLVREVASPTLQTPYATQASIGYSRQLNPRVGINVDLVSVRYKHLPFRFKANPIVPETGTRLIADQGDFRLWYGNGEAQYDGINFQVKSRLTDRLEFQGFYTFSEAEGNVLAGSDEFRLTQPNHQPDLSAGTRRDVSVNPLDPACAACFGPLNTDAEHRVTFAGFYRLPLDFYLSAVFRYRSALPYLIHSGADDNRDGFALDLPAGVDHVNAGRGASAHQLDLRLSKLFTIGEGYSIELIGEVFNVFDEDNPVRFVGNQADPNFGEAATFAGDPGQGENRLGQLGLRFRF
jgi:hypothetical protein